ASACRQRSDPRRFGRARPVLDRRERAALIRAPPPADRSCRSPKESPMRRALAPLALLLVAASAAGDPFPVHYVVDYKFVKKTRRAPRTRAFQSCGAAG